MNNIGISLALALCTSISSGTYAGKWVDWDTVMTDISDYISTTVEAIVNLTNSITSTSTSIVATNVVTTKKIILPGVNSVKLSGVGSLIVTHNDTQDEGLVAEADESIMPYIDIQIKNNELAIKIKENISFQLTNPIVYRINSINIANINVAGAITTEISDLKGETLNITATGSAQVSGTVSVKNLGINCSGACALVLSGNADTQTITISGSGTFDGKNLNGQTMHINGSGAVKLYSNVSNAITGTLSGCGSLLYTNNPTVTVQTSHAASITKQ